MRLVIPFALLLATTGASRQGCGSAPYDPCAGKACGDSCHLCAPDDSGCVETMDLKVCDPSHRCVSLLDRTVDELCGAPTACAGKACGAACTIDPPCRSATPPCMVPSFAGYCTGDGGACVATAPPCPSGPPPPSWGCVGKACGDFCGYCPPGQDPATCPVPTFAATACDAQLQCQTVGTFTCSPQAACLGKACGAACETCPACMHAYAMACDASAACVPVPVACGP